MTDPWIDGEQLPTRDDAGGGPPRRSRLQIAVPVLVVGAVLATGFALAGGLKGRPAATRPAAQASSESAPSQVVLSGTVGPGSSDVGFGARSPSSGSFVPRSGAGPALVAEVDASGGLATMDASGGSVTSYSVPGVTFDTPAWSPDGTHIAAVGSSTDDTSIYVFAVPDGSVAEGPEPLVIYRSADRPPFYLYWAPDSLSIAFLAIDANGLTLRVAPADGSAPLDGSGPGSIVRGGDPLYFDWEAADRLLLHVGDGSGSFAGEVRKDGTSVAAALPGTGDFRAASASRDGRYLAYVRSSTGSPDEIVVASRTGSSAHSLQVFGPAAFLFDPKGDALAAIAADKPQTDPLGFPLGPLRLVNAGSGAVRTLLDGSVLAFFWAPDGRTIAAIRVGLSGNASADAGAGMTTVSLARPVAATPAPVPVVHLVFVDVATGTTRSDRVVELGDKFVNAILPYFDQYALSHRLWAPDSSAILLPLVDSVGREQLVVVPADGTESRPIADGISGFWSP